MACHSKRDDILIYDKDELILYNVNDINTTIKKMHGTQLNHLISLTYAVQDKKFNKNLVKRKLSNKDDA
ncbi:unnamed protein product, partial [Rotaria sp. Silwood1]